jgi:hypothetical protein
MRGFYSSELTRLETQTPAHEGPKACPLDQILCPSPPFLHAPLANACPLSRILCPHSPSPRPREISAPPSPRPHTPSPRPHAPSPRPRPLRSRATPTPPSSVVARHRTPPPKRGRKRAAPENLHFNPESLHVKTQKRLGSDSLSLPLSLPPSAVRPFPIIQT